MLHPTFKTKIQGDGGGGSFCQKFKKISFHVFFAFYDIFWCEGEGKYKKISFHVLVSYSRFKLHPTFLEEKNSVGGGRGGLSKIKILFHVYKGK